MRCPICGMIRDKQASVCPRCGYDDTIELRQTFCPECGTPTPEKAKVCLMCGTSVEEAIRPPRIPRIPLPRIPGAPIPLPDSIRLSSAVAIVAAFALLVGIVKLVGPLLAQSMPAEEAIALVTPEELQLPTATPTSTATYTPTATPTETPTSTPTPVQIHHVVSAGENPGSIAAKYDVPLEQIMEVNDIKDPTGLRVGQVLVIPPTWTPEGVPSDATPTPTPMVYFVQAGDNLSSIAAWAGVSVESIMKLNKLDNPRWLSVGQRLLIPASTGTGTSGPTPTPDVEVAIHIIQPGESLLAIAMDYHTTVKAIMQMNHLENEQFIRAGESLMIPVGTPTPTPPPTPLPTPTPTPGPPYAAPIPLAPAQEEHIWGDSEPVLLNWISVGVLREDDWYLVELHHPTKEGKNIEYGWTRSTSWRVPISLHPGPDTGDHAFHWQVWVVRSHTPDADPGGLKPRSPHSPMRTFYWY